MKKLIPICSLAFLAAISCRQDDYVIDCVPSGQLVNVCVKADMGSDDSDTRVNVSGLSLSWNADDAIGIFAGPNNMNRRFTIEGEASSKNATFTGTMLPTGEDQTMLAYYPYDPDATDPDAWRLNFDGQVYDGDFSEYGSGTDLGHYLYMVVLPQNGFQITEGSGWPSDHPLNFNKKLASMITYKISSTLTTDFTIDRIDLFSAAKPFHHNPSINISGGMYSCSPKDLIGVSLKNQLTMESGNKSGLKYVHMAAGQSVFNEGTDLQVLVYGMLGDKYVRMTVPKHVTSSADFKFGKRTTINVQLSDDTNYSEASSVGVVITGNSCVSPELIQDSGDGQPGTITWGDGTSEPYAGGIIHQYGSSTQYTASFNYWGEGKTIKFSNLENISSIDLSKF